MFHKFVYFLNLHIHIPQSLYNTIVASQASFHVSYPNIAESEQLLYEACSETIETIAILSNDKTVSKAKYIVIKYNIYWDLV